MPKTIASGFSVLKSNLEITSLQKSTVSTRQTNVRIAVGKGFNVLDSFLAGSYPRATMLSPLSKSDIDIFVILNSEYFHTYSPSKLLDKLRSVLKTTYPKTPKISRNGQAVTITFTDFKVDVVPCFKRKGGGYLIPNSITDKWIPTNPTVHHNNLTKENDWHDGNLIPLIKMIKGWNRSINNAFNSFYLELLIEKILAGVTITDFPSGVRYIFDKGREAIKYKIVDPAGFGDEINGLNNVGTVEDAIKKFETAYNRAIKAEDYASNGNIELAFLEWQKIFPNYFPNYR